MRAVRPPERQSTGVVYLPNPEGRLAAALFSSSGPEPPPCMDAAIPPSRAHFTLPSRSKSSDRLALRNNPT
jgi:hypothetical protein